MNDKIEEMTEQTLNKIASFAVESMQFLLRPNRDW